MELRKVLVKTLIREVIRYPYKIIIPYNFTDTYEKHDITSDTVKEVEKQSRKKTAFSLPQSSYKFFSSAPSWNELNTSAHSNFYFNGKAAPLGTAFCIAIISISSILFRALDEL